MGSHCCFLSGGTPLVSKSTLGSGVPSPDPAWWSPSQTSLAFPIHTDVLQTFINKVSHVYPLKSNRIHNGEILFSSVSCCCGNRRLLSGAGRRSQPSIIAEHPPFLLGHCCEGHPGPAAACLAADYTPMVVFKHKSQRFLQREVNESKLDDSVGEAEGQESNDQPKAESWLCNSAENYFLLPQFSFYSGLEGNLTFLKALL